MDAETVGLLSRCLEHTNRFVRESGYGLVEELVRVGGLDPARLHQAIVWIAAGLCDNWSQVGDGMQRTLGRGAG